MTLGHPGAALTLVFARGATSTGPVIGAGEILINLASPFLFTSVAAPDAFFATHTATVPNDPALSGMTAFTQALILGGGGELCNAIDLLVAF